MSFEADLEMDQEMLLRQMQHRVANSLQIAASTLSLKARTANSHDARPHLMNAYSRVDAPKAATVRLDYHKGA
jgi:chemotaxis protein methyltransferase CheR